MSRPMWMVKLIKKGFKTRFTLAKFTRNAIIGKLTEAALFKSDDIYFLPMNKTVRVGKQLDEPESVALPSVAVERFVEKSNHLWLMNECICRSASHCHHYPTNMGCLFLGEAAKDINPELGRSVSKKEALNHLQRSRDAGLVHLLGRNKLDAVWLNVKPGHRLLTICSCCECCCLWRMIPNLSERIAGKVRPMPGVKVEVTDRCVGCGTCAQGVCFVNAISMKGKRAFISKECRSCGRCVAHCPHGAIELTVENPGYIDEVVKNLDALVDLS